MHWERNTTASHQACAPHGVYIHVCMEAEIWIPVYVTICYLSRSLVALRIHLPFTFPMAPCLRVIEVHAGQQVVVHKRFQWAIHRDQTTVDELFLELAHQVRQAWS